MRLSLLVAHDDRIGRRLRFFRRPRDDERHRLPAIGDLIVLQGRAPLACRSKRENRHRDEFGGIAMGINLDDARHRLGGLRVDPFDASGGDGRTNDDRMLEVGIEVAPMLRHVAGAPGDFERSFDARLPRPT